MTKWWSRQPDPFDVDPTWKGPFNSETEALDSLLVPPGESWGGAVYEQPDDFSPHTPTRPESCQFCAIIDGAAPARIVAETATSVSFLPDVPAVLGHVLVVPRSHVRDLWDLDDEQARALGSDVLATARVVRSALRPEGLNVIQSNGAAAGQSVFHLHVHVVPRATDDRMPELWPVDAQWDVAQLDSIANALRAATPG